MDIVVNKARKVLEELQAVIKANDGFIWHIEEDVSASQQEIIEALGVAILVLSKVEIVPTGR